MKKIFIILLCMITLNANATEMCARNDTVVIPLDATINGTGSWNATENLWWVNFSYGTIYGGATCLSRKEVMMYSDWNGVGNNVPSVLNVATDELIGLSGYYMNADENPDIPDDEINNYARSICFFKMTHPMSSRWAFASVSQLTVSNCLTRCFQQAITYNIGNPGVVVGSLRDVLFNSVGTIPPWSE